MCLLLGEETGEVQWGSGYVFLTTPSLPQCQDVISKLKNNHYRVDLHRSSSYVAQFLLPQLLKIRTITMISIYSTKVTKDNIISLQLSNNTTLKTLGITNGSIKAVAKTSAIVGRARGVAVAKGTSSKHCSIIVHSYTFRITIIVSNKSF